MLRVDDKVQNNIKQDTDYRNFIQGVTIACNKMITKMDVSNCELFEIDNGKTRRIILDVYFDTDTVVTNLQHVEYLHKIINIEVGSNKYAKLFDINIKYEKHD